mgnify:CR=1 FL=1
MKTIKYLIIILIVLGCEKSKNISLNKMSPKQTINIESEFDKVVIIGKSDDSIAFKYFNVFNHSAFSSKNYIEDEKVINDSLFLVIDSISNPQFINIFASGTGTIYKTQVLIKANDTLVFEIKNKKIKFIGKNASQNNFYSSLFDSTPDYIYNSYQGSINNYKRHVDSIYNRKVDFFDQYIKDNKITSKNFISKVKSDLKFQHLHELISPRTKKASEVYFGDPDGLIPIIQKEFNNNEVFFDFNNYFGNITIDDLKNESLLDNQFFQSSMIFFIRNIFENSEYPKYSKEKLLAEKKFIESNFEGRLKNYAIARIIIDYHQKGFGNSSENITFFRDLISEQEETFSKTTFKEMFKEISDDLKTYDFKLSEASLNTILISKDGDSTTLKNIFSRSTKRIKVIDFWASWCSPCINEIKKAKSFKDKLSIENNVEWIYLSMDEDKENWLKKSKDLKEFLNVRNQYLILDGKNSALAKSLKVSWIPRYIIVNKENQIVLNNAPRPSDSIVFSKIIYDIKSDLK